MFKGQIVEIGEAETIYQQPQHAYSRTLLAAVPRPDPERSEGSASNWGRLTADTAWIVRSSVLSSSIVPSPRTCRI